MDSSHRLDAVVRWRSQQERHAQKAHVEAERDEEAARAAERALLEKHRAPHAAGDAALWVVTDLSRARTELELREAAQVREKATLATQAALAARRTASQKKTVMENLVESVLERARLEVDMRERRELDELAVLRFARR